MGFKVQYSFVILSQTKTAKNENIKNKLCWTEYNLIIYRHFEQGRQALYNLVKPAHIRVNLALPELFKQLHNNILDFESSQYFNI